MRDRHAIVESAKALLREHYGHYVIIVEDTTEEEQAYCRVESSCSPGHLAAILAWAANDGMSREEAESLEEDD